MHEWFLTAHIYILTLNITRMKYVWIILYHSHKLFNQRKFSNDNTEIYINHTSQIKTKIQVHS